MSIVSPARIDSLKATSAARGFGFCVESSASFEATGFASPFARRGLIQICARQDMTSAAVRHRPANGSDGRILPETAMRQKFFAQDLFYWFFVSPAPNDRISWNIKLARPLSKRICFAAISKVYIVAAIVTLLNAICPFAVFRGIRTIVINAFNRTAKWTLSHIGKKVIEPLPRAANVDTPRAVIFIPVISRICAPSQHTRPDAISFRMRHSVCAASHLLTPSSCGAQYGRI